LAEAESLLRRAAVSKPHRSQALNNLGNLLWRLRGDKVRAKAVYLEGLADAPGDKLLRRNYAIFLSRNRDMRMGLGAGSGLQPLDEGDPLEEMATVDAAAIRRREA
jgi:Flp pilus assembly protein TadD